MQKTHKPARVKTDCRVSAVTAGVCQSCVKVAVRMWMGGGDVPLCESSPFSALPPLPCLPPDQDRMSEQSSG